MITLDTPLKFTAPGGVAYFGRGKWHLPHDGQPGDWMPDYKSRPILCQRGYHWCEARHAVYYLHAECYFIEPRGMTVRGEDKCVSQGGRLLRRVETWNDRTARLFAADCAEAVVYLCGDDPRPRAAIEAARRFARGQATQNDMDDARAAALGAALGAVKAANAAAKAAAWAAAQDDAWAAAKAAAWAAANAAAQDDAGLAAKAAAWAAAKAAANAAQIARLLQYLNGEVE